MSEHKWTVLGGGTAWTVVHPGDVFRGGDGLLECWDVHSRHGTWEEAIQEADRMARTVTVTLPANPDVVLPAVRIMTSRDPEGVWTERAYRVAWDWEVTIPDAYRETVALALLAHARKEQHRG